MSDTVYVSRLTEDIHSTQRPGHVHRAGTEIAPIRRVSADSWLMSIRSRDPTGFWYEELEIRITQSEVVEVPIHGVEESNITDESS